MARVNLTTVAREAGVAVSTASLVLNGKAATVGLAQETVLRIRLTAERLGYTPNHNARSLRLRRSGMVGVILAGSSHSRDSLMNGIRQVLDETSEQMVPLMAMHEYDSEREYRELRFLVRNQVEAIITTPKGPYERNYAPLIASGVPTIFAIHSLADACPDGPSTVLHDNLGMARDGYLHLAATGAKRIAYLAWDYSTLVSHEKLLGVQQAKLQAKESAAASMLTGVFMQAPHSSFEAALDSLFSDPATAPDALLCNPYNVALHCLDFLDRRKISVPRQCQLLSLNNNSIFNYRRVPVSAMSEDAGDIGRRAAELALNLIVAKSPKVFHERHHNYRLVERETTLSVTSPLS